MLTIEGGNRNPPTNRGRGRGGPFGVKKEEINRKRKLLWSKKPEEPKVPSAWSTAAFDDPTQKNKFLSLIGAKKKKKNIEDFENIH